uniref:Uncharacterized protein n=1 Tax=Anopheles farauti TaxID=69004 RepID=A0A182QPJ6_9DIPT
MSRICGSPAGTSTTFIVRVAIFVWNDGAASVISQLYLPLLCGSRFTNTRSHSHTSVALVPTSTANGTCMWTLSRPSTLRDTVGRRKEGVLDTFHNTKPNTRVALGTTPRNATERMLPGDKRNPSGTRAASSGQNKSNRACEAKNKHATANRRRTTHVNRGFPQQRPSWANVGHRLDRRGVRVAPEPASWCDLAATERMRPGHPHETVPRWAVWRENCMAPCSQRLPDLESGDVPLHPDLVPTGMGSWSRERTGSGRQLESRNRYRAAIPDLLIHKFPLAPVAPAIGRHCSHMAGCVYFLLKPDVYGKRLSTVQPHTDDKSAAIKPRVHGAGAEMSGALMGSRQDPADSERLPPGRVPVKPKSGD